MRGIDWQVRGRQMFEDVVEILLAREFGSRGHAVNGRGGDRGIDFNVDDGKIIFQLKFFPDGFPASGSRRRQISKSFKTAITEHDPDEWILVVPATVTPSERKFVTGLGKAKRVKIMIRDKTWLENSLIQHPDIADHYQFASDIDYLYAKAEVFKTNPVIRDAGDVATRIQDVQQSIDVIDPNWTLDVASVGSSIVQTLRPKDPGAPTRAPVTISFRTQTGTEEALQLSRAIRFGHSEPISLSKDAVHDFKITGTRLLNSVAESVERIEIQPTTGGQSVPAEVVLFDRDDQRLGVHLVQSRPLGQGSDGYTIQVDLENLITIVLRSPRDTSGEAHGEADWRSRDVAGASIREALAAARFVLQLSEASTMKLQVKGKTLLTAGVDHWFPTTEESHIAAFQEIEATADDLLHIEDATNVRFRYPPELSTIDRIGIRNLRLMLEGHCVAHPTANIFQATLNGTWSDSIKATLTTDDRWFLHRQEPAELIVLDQTIQLPELGSAALAHLEQEELDAALKAFEDGTAEGHQVTFKLREHDRVRMFLPDRHPPDEPLEITPWGLPGFNQQGLQSDGTPFQ